MKKGVWILNTSHKHTSLVSFYMMRGLRTYVTECKWYTIIIVFNLARLIRWVHTKTPSCPAGESLTHFSDLTASNANANIYTSAQMCTELSSHTQTTFNKWTTCAQVLNAMNALHGASELHSHSYTWRQFANEIAQLVRNNGLIDKIDERWQTSVSRLSRTHIYIEDNNVRNTSAVMPMDHTTFQLFAHNLPQPNDARHFGLAYVRSGTTFTQKPA